MPKIENIDYELVPSDEHEQAWHVRIKEGDFVETVIQYGAIRFNEVKDHMSFNFHVISSPDPDVTSENEDLQIQAGEILESIIASGLEDGSTQMEEVKK